ncbi:putative quinate permease [Colletotrichum sp. SAR 10_99]|nr:putative quinate permease [Colletotrichum sp. SAR 10_96]KAI8293885.1 putative quinate permease [Colletotrichum sp. SAR 10_98]KAJ5017811.1 putative quinate permease [Colletotrichum sp. SAR 10_99]
MAIIDKKIYEQTPKEAISWKILCYAIILSFSGSAHGFNTANISGVLAFSPFKKHFELSGMSEESLADWKAWITSMLILGSCVGSLVIAPINDKLGRKWSLGLSAFVYSVSAILMSANPGGAGGRAELLVGRFLSGAGSGAASVVGTNYMAEIAPSAIRGGLTASYNANTMLSVGLAYWINYGALLNLGGSNAQWQVPMGVQALPGIILIVGLFFVPESPRWLLSKGKSEAAEVALENLRSLPRDHAYLRQELYEIRAGIEHELALSPGFKGFLREMASSNVRKRLALVMMMQIGFQFSGGNTLTYYMTSILESIGITSNSFNYLFAGIYGMVKFLSVVLYCLFIIDRLGRRTGLFVGSSLILVSLTYITVFLAVSDKSGEISKAGGLVAVVFIYIFAVGYSFSWAVAPYIINAEAFPTKIRSTCMAICIAWQYLVNFALSRAQPNMVLAMHSWGPFCLFTCVTLCMTVYAYFAYPETKGLSMEHMEELFNMPWYRVGRASTKVIIAVGAEPTLDEKKERGINVEQTEDAGKPRTA